MPDFTKRSYQKELLDRDDIPFEDIQRNMQELNFINTKLGGHAITISGFKQLAGNNNNVAICEIGCGGGDNLTAIYKSNDKKGNYTFVGIDINPNCIEYAKRACAIPNVNFITSDYKLVNPEPRPGIIFSSLFCHHFTDEELIEMLQWMNTTSTIGFFINDLHRHPIAWHFIRITSKLFSRSYLVKNDAPLSVLRGFKKKEWISLLEKAGIKNYTIKWKWAFRYLVVVKKTEEGVAFTDH